MSLDWFAIRVKSNFEKHASLAFQARGIEEYLPVYSRIASYRGRSRQVELPLFPGYLFSRFDINQRQPVVTVPGFLYIVAVGRSPAAVDPAELAAVRTTIESGLPVEPSPFINAGDRMVIEKGALRGLEGIVISARKGWRLVVSVTLLQRSVAVEIDRSWVRRLHPAFDGAPEPGPTPGKVRAVAV